MVKRDKTKFVFHVNMRPSRSKTMEILYWIYYVRRESSEKKRYEKNRNGLKTKINPRPSNTNTKNNNNDDDTTKPKQI